MGNEATRVLDHPRILGAIGGVSTIKRFEVNAWQIVFCQQVQYRIDIFWACAACECRQLGVHRDATASQ